MTSYALYLGCTIPARQPNHELSTRKALGHLGVDLVELANATCCAPPPIESVELKTSTAIGAYNICLAEEQNLDIVTICGGCFQSLAGVNARLKQDAHLKDEVNKILAKTGKEYKGTQEVKHYLQVLTDDIGLPTISQNVVKSLKGIRVASFYGCHVLRPSALLKFDDPERPQILDNLVEATGAQSIDYLNKKKCCGGLLRGYEDDLALEIARDKIANVSNAQADCITTVCPFCFVALDIGQLQLNRKFNENYNIPVLHYPELLCLAFGIDPKEIAIGNRRIKANSLLQRIM
ncbi:MAG: CoB--CoM heterodisulfide reductase iron-sulfur subunit B family protein [Candidatus Bathyarchaeota archaeon]|jgi:heterodisulfide reductase subunit B|nr:CoB--CoM heterodisulfide reductase iron-sulfur subunit B family protein [Candidatus Bathyarchaeota archaeon]